MAGLIERLRFLFTGRAPKAEPAELRPMARIDAAQTSDENKRHWANADAFSADSAYDPATRFKLRNRGRYEVVNNCYAKASVRAAADDLVGTCPRLQLTLAGDNGNLARQIEWNYWQWADETGLGLNLRVAEKSLQRDGGSFAIFDTNERLRNPVKFDLRWVEDEMCTTPFDMGNDPQVIDGIRFDRLGKPIEYYFLKVHPGNLLGMTFNPLAYYAMPAEKVVHWFIPDRHGQHRAIPEITPALPLYSQLRRYTLATLTAAEFAAMIAGVMKTTGPPGSEVTKVEDWSLWEIVRGALLTIPEGWDASQFQATQPTASYGDFKRELLNESGRSNGQPLNVISGNSSGYNYSSGRLDHLPYQRSLKVRRYDCRRMVLDPILRAWYAEAVMVGQVPAEAPPIGEWRWCWNWDGFDSIDATKDAMADDVRIKNGTSTYAEILAEYGQDWAEVFDQLAKEKAYAESLGLPWPVLFSAPAAGGAAGSAPAGPANLEDTVATALEQIGISESQAAEVLEQLGPTFALLRSRAQAPINGHSGRGSK